jgi:hypothetical protein
VESNLLKLEGGFIEFAMKKIGKRNGRVDGLPINSYGEISVYFDFCFI